jgi:hypothetical protein
MKNLLIFLVLSMMSLNIQATLLTDLLNGQSMTAGDKQFDQWQVLFEDSSDFISVNTDNIDVTALNDGGLDPGPGLKFDILNNEFLVEGDGIYAYLDFMFGFRVTVLDPDLLVQDNSLFLTNAELLFPSSLTSVFIEETIYTDSTLNDSLGVKEVELSNVFGNVTDKAFDSATFNPKTSIYVTKNILVEAWDIDESANLLSFEQRFSQVEVPPIPLPEPAPLWILLAGLALIGISKKRLIKI